MLTTPRAKELRRTMTDAEQRLWGLLRGRQLAGYKFRRQHPVGPYVIDFACVSHRLGIEADGSQHFESVTDEARTAWLAERGWRVLRFWNTDILTESQAVLETVRHWLEKPDVPMPPSPSHR